MVVDLAAKKVALLVGKMVGMLADLWVMSLADN